MRQDQVWKLIFIGVALLLLGFGGATLAQNGDTYALRRWSADGGGATSSTMGAYTLGGTVGQFDAGTLDGVDYTLRGGFWGGAVTQYHIYLPLVIRD